MNSFTSNIKQIDYMSLAIKKAKLGKGFVNPNPQVGAVIVKNDIILGTGYHHCYGQLHAEREAIKDALDKGNDIEGSTIYVTLEPCCHHGKQPPCTQAIIDSGIKKVIIGSRDPNPIVNGKGVKQLLEAGIQVEQDFFKTECDSINTIFFHYIQTKKPYIIVKYAMTADGLTATSSGESKWISNEKSREYVHQVRNRVMAVMTGIQTVLKDDPLLNVRLPDDEPHHQPARIVCDTNLQIPLDSKLVNTADQLPLYIAVREDLSDTQTKKINQLKEKGVNFIKTPLGKDNHIDLSVLIRKIGELKIDSILVESGGTLTASMLFSENNTAPLADEIDIFVAPKIFGTLPDKGQTHTPVHSKGVSIVDESIKLSTPKITSFGSDILLQYKVIKDNHSQNLSLLEI